MAELQLEGFTGWDHAGLVGCLDWGCRLGSRAWLVAGFTPGLDHGLELVHVEEAAGCARKKGEKKESRGKRGNEEEERIKINK